MSIFTTIKRAVINALNEDDIYCKDDRTFTIECKYYPSGALNWFYRTGAFAIQNVSRERKGKNWLYTITIKDVDPENRIFENTGLRCRRTKDEYDPLKYRWYSTGRTDTEAYNNPNIEKIDFRDMVCSDKIVYDLKYNSYDEMVEQMGRTYADDLAWQKARDFENNEKAPEWSYSDEYEDELV